MFTFIKTVAYTALYMTGYAGAKIAGLFGADRAQRQWAALAWTAGMCLLVGPVFMLGLAVVCTVIAFASSVAIAKWFGASVSEAVKTMYDIVIEF